MITRAWCVALALAFSSPAFATRYVYDVTGAVRNNGLLGNAGDTFHGSFSFDTETPLYLDFGTGRTYRDIDDVGIAPAFTYIRDHDGFTIRSFNQDARITVHNDWMVDDYVVDLLVITSRYLQSPTLAIPPHIEMQILLRGLDSQVFSSADIPDGLPPFEALETPGTAFVFGSASGVLTSMTWIPGGDLNRDGFVGLVDLDRLLFDWNQTVPPADPASDPSGDGFVGLDDLDMLISNWNTGTPPAGNPIPEPSGLALLILSAALLARRG